jgi:hypothetical protein
MTKYKLETQIAFAHRLKCVCKGLHPDPECEKFRGEITKEAIALVTHTVQTMRGN